MATRSSIQKQEFLEYMSRGDAKLKASASPYIALISRRALDSFLFIQIKGDRGEERAFRYESLIEPLAFYYKER